MPKAEDKPRTPPSPDDEGRPTLLKFSRHGTYELERVVPLPGGTTIRLALLVDDGVMEAFERLLDAVPPEQRPGYDHLGGALPFNVYVREYA